MEQVEAGVRQSHINEVPEIWAVAGVTPRNGHSETAFLLACSAACETRPVWLFAGAEAALEAGPAGRIGSPLDSAEMRRLQHRLDEPCRHSAQLLYRRLSRVSLRESSAPLWIVDLGCSRSHLHWDLFWGADLALLVNSGRDPATAQGMIDSARQRWLERTLAPEEISLHAALQREKPLGGEQLPRPLADSRKLSRLGGARIIYQVGFEASGDAAAVPDPVPAHHPAEVRDQLFDAGSLICGLLNRELLTAAGAAAQPLMSLVCEELITRLTERFEDPATRGKGRRPPWDRAATRLAEQRILNIDLTFFDPPAVVSPYGATDENI